jgi:deazaflavin-dependent oxidoreductase (nitroreductase family)
LASLVAQPVPSRFFLRFATLVDRPLMRWSGGRLKISVVIPLLLLRCRGARTGLWREIPLLCAPDGDALIVVASNGGGARPPAWCANLRKHPDAQWLMRGERRACRAMELAGEAREYAWRLAVRQYPGYEVYARRVSAPIPVFRLVPLDDQS